MWGQSSWLLTTISFLPEVEQLSWVTNLWARVSQAHSQVSKMAHLGLEHIKRQGLWQTASFISMDAF